MNQKSPSLSPTIKATPIQEQPVIDFPTAMQQVINGKTITKLEWNSPETKCFLDQRLRIQIKSTIHDWIVSDGDMKGDDWVIIDS